MCHFITATVSSDADLVGLNGLLSHHDLRFHEVENKQIERQIPSGLKYGTLTHGHCDCGTTLGAGDPTDSLPPIGKHKIQKMKRRGWSEKRIQAWIEQQQDGRKRAVSSARKFRMAEIEQWCTVVHESLISRHTSSLGLLKHWYSLGVHDERFEISVTQVKIEKATQEFLVNISEDVLYVFS